ncbi:tRNA nucleotidyltransferase (CCA-adding enzyme) [Thermosyntropha lipolytica DSM 11003]|uniref:tRNA nucleotidyltransferase (CCA-adding enzyme) n=1 Tax=Thermosyntropha lipolytica DSM 11003 TaxID=1123382 RepID=A0A1M5P8M8_9FIRM|nr:CBS domain-containing protein [Thermosyntropha lipolytica]SHG98164.1 tRNA nucleotidyltransferase (CCA-adding enzyme) [Thermosyntropha lipolytica DSM 11003]
MDVITSHNALDFDGLAAMVAANKLYPSGVKVLAGTLSKNVKKFMAIYKDSLFIKNPREIDFDEVKRLIIVDTASAHRLGKLKELAGREDIEIHVYDHHPVMDDDIKGTIKEVQEVGAATTILVEKIMEKDLEITPFEATILALGIYEDTGSLLFQSTTYRDAYAVAYLLQKGANLSVIANFMELSFSEEQKGLWQELLQSVKHFNIGHTDIAVAWAIREDFIPGLDVVTYRLMEVENSEAVFTLVLMEGKVNIVGRSRTDTVKVNEVLAPWGGRGHEKAASTVVKGKSVEEMLLLLEQRLKDSVLPGLTARDIMSSPVKTIPLTFTMEEAGKVMLRYGHTGMPVVDGDKMVGVISRRDVDKARMHNLGHAPVKAFMTTGVKWVTPDTPVAQVQKIMVENDIGRLPVIENGRLIGIVSRTDILRVLHGDEYPEDHMIMYQPGGHDYFNVKELLEAKMPYDILHLLKTAGEVAEELGYKVYCVGGFVRDLLLSYPNFDIDLVVEGEGEKLAISLAERLGGRVRIHKRFGTAVVIINDDFKIDVATARTEYYEFPAALPKVEKSSLREDLYRRDFTINTLAVALNPDRYGELIDYFGGRRDLEQKYIRILYNLSFIEDPTRIMRAIRFETRYGFTIEPDTLRLAQDAVERRMLGKLSYKRILQELILILSEPDPMPALIRMKEIGVWEYVLPDVDLDRADEGLWRRIPSVVAWFKERYHALYVKTWLVYLGAILALADQESREKFLACYPLDRQALKAVKEIEKAGMVWQEIAAARDIKSSWLDKLINGWEKESLIYLLLLVREEKIWEKIVEYLDRKEKIKLEINGHDLRILGLKPGPVYKKILDELYLLKLDGIVKDKDEEINMVKKWIKESWI